MELKVGMYVRFKDKRGIQYIRKITSVNTEKPERRYAAIYIDKDANSCNGVSLKNIVGEPSFDLIDLIEVGDYVNGNKVTKLGFDKLLLHCKTIECHQEDLSRGYEGVTFMYTNNDIKDVITKEQFNSMKYVVESDNQ